MNRLFWFAYSVGARDERHRIRPHHLRDGQAAAEMLPPLVGRSGLRYAGVLHNPMDGNSAEMLPLRNGDVILLVTRPFLHDHAERPNIRQGAATGYWLEQEIYAAQRLVFDYCSRRHVQIANELVPFMDADDRDFANAFFGPNLYLGTVVPQEPRHSAPKTALLYLSYLPVRVGAIASARNAQGPVDCHVLSVFGMSGTATLLWSWLLREIYWRRLRLDLKEPKFIVAAIEHGDVPLDAVSLEFARDWKIRILLNESLETRFLHARAARRQIVRP